MQKQNNTLRKYALANFKDMARAMAVDGALNIWLNNNDNYIQSPNENLAREFMELFTLGVNKFTQHDVTAAARALTGYSTAPSNGTVTFNPKQHYAESLSVLGRKSKLNAASLASLIVSKEENRKFITDRVWFRFVSSSTTPPTTLARSFAGRDISSLVSTLVHSTAWSNPANSLVKSPVEWFVGACRALKVRPSTLSSGDLQWELSQMGQLPFNPPNVGGWPYGQAWLSGVAFQYRFELAQSVVAKGVLAPLAVPKSKMVQACADWLGVAEWSRRTASAFAAVSAQMSLETLASAASSSPLPLATPILVLVTLYGGNDGLNTVVPFTDPTYQSVRSNIALSSSQLLPITDSLALNSSMPSINTLYGKNKVAIVQGVSYPNPSLSHFSSMAIWQSASLTANVSSGWIGRWLDIHPHSAFNAIG